MSGPKLLDKKIVTAEVASQKKQQIDMGISIAKKVDALRDTLQTEEQNLENFRTFTLKQVQSEIDGYIRQRDTIKDEIVILEQKKELAAIPLDAEWEKVRAVNGKLVQDRITLDQKFHNLGERQQEIEKDEKELENEKDRISNLKEQAIEKLVQADYTLSQAREEAAMVRNKAQTVLLTAELREKDILAKDEELETKRKTILVLEQRLVTWETDLQNREKLLKDRQETLARTINRLKK